MPRFTELEHPKMQESLKQLMSAMDDSDSFLYQLLLSQDSHDDIQEFTH